MRRLNSFKTASLVAGEAILSLDELRSRVWSATVNAANSCE